MTGLTRAIDGTWWASNHGLAQMGDSPFAASLVHLSPDFTSILGQILLVPLYPAILSVQGIVMDTLDGSIWFADVAGQKIRHITAAGVPIPADDISLSYSPNGLAWDAYSRAVFVNNSANDTAEKISVDTGAVLETFTLAITDHDQMFFDGAYLWATSGTNGSAGTLSQCRIDAGPVARILRSYSMGINADAIEGAYMEGNDAWIGNDAYFHLGGAELNQILKYKLQ